MPVLRLFGAPTVELGGVSIALPFERRTQLAAWLALRGGWVNRAEAAALLWPDQAPRLAFANLRKALFRLGHLPWGASVEQQGSALHWAGSTDVGAFGTALREGRAADALALMRGELLSGFDDDDSEAWTGWLRFERDRLRAAWRAAALGVLADGSDPAANLALAGRLLEADPLDEAALRAQVALLAASGQRARARQACDEFVERLHNELGIEPGAELTSLREALAAEVTRGFPTPLLSPVLTEAPADDGFVGRAAELRLIADLLSHRQVRLLTITGPGGIGKTRLVRRALRDLAGEYADGAYFAALEDANDADALLARIARATGVALHGGAPAIDQVRAAFADKQMLLALDNFDQLADTCAAVLEPMLAAAPRLVLLVTSRVRLGVASEQLLPLDGLLCPEAEDADRVEAFDAARLFVAAAHRVSPTLLPQAEARAIVDICRQLDGLPLALELAAAWTRVLTCGEIAAELREGAVLLRDDSGTRAPRHASIAQVFAQSWQHLAPIEREALARLSVFQGGFTADAARAVAGAPLPVLGALVDKSLMRREGSRLALHPLVQQFAAARLEPAARAQVHGAHAAWFQRVLVQLKPAVAAGERAALQTTDDELENCRQAWRWAVAHGDAAAVRSSGMVLHSHLDYRGRSGEGLGLVQQAIDAPALRADRVLQAWLLTRAAQCEYRLDRYAEAEALAARALSADTADSGTQMLAHSVLGACALRQGHHTEALARFEKAFALAEDEGDAAGAAAELDHQALVHKHLGRYDTALSLTHAALTRYRALGNAAGTAICLSNLGGLHLARDEPLLADPYLGEAVALCEREGLAGPLLFALSNLCDVDVIAGRLDAAHAHAERLAELAHAGGQRSLAAAAVAQRARVALRRREFVAARAALAEAAQAAMVVGTPVAWGNALLVLAELLQAQGEAGAADRVLGFAAQHPAMGHGLRDQIVAERRRAGLPEQCALGWPGLGMDELLQRIVSEVSLGHAPLIALLRA